MKLLSKFLFVIVLTSCSNDKTPSYQDILGTGVLDQDRYSNEYFGLVVKFPKDWIIVNEQEIKERRQMGIDLISPSIDTADLDKNKNPKFLLNINKYPRDSKEAINGNAGFQISFVKKEYLTVKSELEYLNSARDILEFNRNIKNISKLQTAQVGNEGFFSYTNELHLSGFTVFQSSYILDRRDCFLLVSVSYRGDFLKPEIDEILRGITFKSH